ncbi:helix-turn-helix transcriptional regulator, partial [Nonomuraea sp. NPDC049784]|uniref:helix-turn-helix transcriptional regulator n=1 Tax=Nonomuraea sp. NPDC049784 TaxID=3154361 RepID=UPI0033C25D00
EPLARAAIEAGAGVAAVALLGEVLMVLGDADSALATLRRAARDAVTEADRAQYAFSLGINLAWAGADAGACEVLDMATRTLTEPAWLQEAHVYRAVTDCFAGRLTGAARSLARARMYGPMSVRADAHAASMEAWVAAYSGRAESSLAIAGRTLPVLESWRDEAPHALPSFLDALCAAQAFSGRLDAAARTAEQGMELPAAELSVSGFAAYRAMVSRLRGDVAGALRWCGDDLARMPAREPYLGRVLAEQAHALALLGRTTQAREVLAESWAPASRWAFTRQHAMQAAVWVAAVDGDLDGAVRLCLEAVDHAEKHELHGNMMFALHDLVRLGVSAADRLSALTDRVDGPLVRLLSRHARAAGDPASLGAVAGEFERLGLLLFAAEATAQEAAAYRDAGRGTLARGAQTRAWALSKRCPGVSTPALVELATPELTPRQREIVQLAAAGLTNRQIADRLTLSTRTAANHLQAAYDKLGVNDRTQVGRLLASL